MKFKRTPFGDPGIRIREMRKDQKGGGIWLIRKTPGQHRPFIGIVRGAWRVGCLIFIGADLSE